MGKGLMILWKIYLVLPLAIRIKCECKVRIVIDPYKKNRQVKNKAEDF